MNPENIIQELKKLIEKHEAKDPYTEPWTLGREIPGFRALRDGEEWSRQDFSKEMLDGGWRPCLKGENMQPGDESGECYEKPEGSGPKRWVSVKGLLQTSAHMRTKRPLPILSASQIAEGWKEHTGGENPAPGQGIDVMLRDGKVFDACVFCGCLWNHSYQDQDIIAYRIIEPRLIPLGPGDVRCGDELKRDDGEESVYLIQAIHPSGIMLAFRGHLSWETLRAHYLIRRRDSATFEPCSKEAAE